MHSRSSAGITVVEIIVILVLLFILALLALPALLSSTHQGIGTMIRTLSNTKQLYLATQQMALDGAAEKNTNIGWPGDIGGGFSNWNAQLLKGNYISRNDLCKLLSAPGIIISTNDPFTNNQTALLLYAVRTNSPATAVFLTSANFTNTPDGGTLDPDAKPYGKKGCVVFRKGGDGAILKANQINQTNLIGSYVPLCH